MFDSFCAYRLPYSQDIHCLKGGMTEGIRPGFVIAPFDLTAESIITIGATYDAEWDDLTVLLNNDMPEKHSFAMPSKSTTPEDHKTEVEAIISELEGSDHKKTIATKVIFSRGAIDPKNSFHSLSEKLPTAFIFLFYTPISGAWLGASPELLLKSDSSKISTCALAGTRKAGGIGEWDRKNIMEQQIVRDYIMNIFSKFGLNPKYTPTVTRNAGKVEHLYTEICASSPDDKKYNLKELIFNLSPTPALCGFPKSESMDRICRLEKFKRGYYGGFCGIYSSQSDFAFYVNLRSIRFTTDSWCMFAGGGITSQSNPHDEWEETEQKAKGIINNLLFLSQK